MSKSCKTRHPVPDSDTPRFCTNHKPLRIQSIGLPLRVHCKCRVIMRKDLRFALRTLWRSPGFALLAILSLALGIGANTAIFSLLYQVVLRSLPVKDPGALVVLESNNDNYGYTRRDNNQTVFSYPMYKALRDQIGR